MIKEIAERRSIRMFADREVDHALLMDILEAARIAPSAANRQPWKYVVYEGKAKEEVLNAMEQGLKREERGDARLPEMNASLAGAYRTLTFMREAPVVIMVLNPFGSDPFAPIEGQQRVNELWDLISVGASVENLLLAVSEAGLGATWIGFTMMAYEELTKCIGTEDQLVSAIALGWPAQSPAARPRKSFDEIVEFRK